MGIVGAVILTGAMVAVFYYEAGREPPGVPGDIGEGDELFDYAFQVETDTAVDASGALAQGEEWTESFQTQPFSFLVHVEVDWGAHPLAGTPFWEAGEFAYEVAILDEDGEPLVSGQSPLEHAMDDEKATPTLSMNFTVAANNETDAQGFVDDYMASDDVQNTTRAWTVRVRVTDDGIAATPPEGVGAEELRRPFDITVHVDHWHPRLVQDEP